MGGELLAQVRPVVRPQHLQGRLVPAILARRPAGSGPNTPYHVEALGEVRLDAVDPCPGSQLVEEGHLSGRVFVGRGVDRLDVGRPGVHPGGGVVPSPMPSRRAPA